MSMYYVGSVPYSDELYHHGIKGMHWGVRRYTNPDGTLTEEGKARYGTIENYNASRLSNKAKDAVGRAGNYAKARWEAGESERTKQREEARKASIERGHKMYDSGYKHSSNFLRTAGNLTVKAAGYGLAADATRALGMKHVSRLIGAAGVISSAFTVRDSYEKARDYERYRKVRR
jgi:hypothetical protein